MEEPRRYSDPVAEAARALSEARLIKARAEFELARSRALAERLNFNILKRVKSDKKRPPQSGMLAPVEPPKGPQPLQGGAAAPLDFD